MNPRTGITNRTSGMTRTTKRLAARLLAPLTPPHAAVLVAYAFTGFAVEGAAAERTDAEPAAGPAFQCWISTEDSSARLTPQPELRFRAGPTPGRASIQLDDVTTYQSVLGLGSSFEHSTCYNLSLLSPDQRELNHPEFPATILRDTLQTEYRADYYIYGQFMKFIQTGAVRIASSAASCAPANVAFRNPDGSVVLVVAHTESKPREVTLNWRGRVLTTPLPARSVATFRWNGASSGDIQKPEPDAR